MLRRIPGLRFSFRNKLLLLTLAPIMLVIPIAVALTIYWGQGFSYEQLYRKVRADLRVAEQALGQLQRRYLIRLRGLADSRAFRRELAEEDGAALRKLLRGFRQRNGLAFLHVTDREGHRRFGPAPDEARRYPSVLHQRVLTGHGAAGLEVFDPPALRGETPGAGEAGGRRALVIRLVQPVEREGRVIALLDGGLVINGHSGFADGLREIVYGGNGMSPEGRGEVGILLGGTRIAAGLADSRSQPVLGTRADGKVRRQVLGEGHTRAGRFRLGGTWYIAAYQPLTDTRGHRVGMLQAGFREAPFRDRVYTALGSFLGLLGVAGVLAVGLGVFGVNRLFRPVRAVAEVVRATRAGEERRIGEVASQDEVGELAREFDSMLDRLQERNRQLREAAEQLEAKVDERTRKLSRRNQELRRTVTQLRRTRRQLVEAEKRVALGELTAGVAHEVNNPTAVILNNLEVVIEELGEDLDPVRGEIDLILEQVDRIRTMVSTLSQYARPSRQEARPEAVDIREAVEDTFLLVQKSVEQAGVRLERDLRERGPVRINRQELQQVLVNLLVNAVQATGKGGTVRVLSRAWDHRGVRLGVADDGEGIPPESRSRLFNPFYTTKAEGTGLGLAVSYGIIRGYGGDITVESSPGQGATFWVWLRSRPAKGDSREGVLTRTAPRVPGDDEPPGSSPRSPPP